MDTARPGDPVGAPSPDGAPGAVRNSLQTLRSDLLMSERASRARRLASLAGHSTLFLITSSSAIVVLFIFYFIFKDAVPFFQIRGIASQ